MKVIDFALGALIALLLATGTAQARDWRWYPRPAPADSDALRPELEGTKRDDGERDGISDIDEMRDWLRRRDEDRRQQGITVPDTVEQLEPAGNVTVPRRRQWPDSAVPGFDLGRSAASGDADGVTDEQSERVRDTLFPHSYSKKLRHGARKHGRHYRFTSSQRLGRHGAAGSGKKRGSSRKRR